MIEHSQRRVPVPVAVAAVILLAGAAIPGSMMFANGPSVATGLIGVLLLLALAYGLWRGSGRARFWTTVFSTASVGYGVFTITKAEALGLLQIAGASVIVGLLLVPASSRRWFHEVPGGVTPARRASLSGVVTACYGAPQLAGQSNPHGTARLRGVGTGRSPE